MAGRRPTPTHLKLLQGNPGKRPINDAEPKPEAKKPRAPAHLDDEARREWDRMADKLHKVGLLTEIDKAALAAYCVAWSRWVEAEAMVKRYGLVILSPDKGFPVHSPYLSVANRAMEQMLKCAAEFGMTPSSRSRTRAVKPEQGSEDPMERLLSGRSRTA